MNFEQRISRIAQPYVQYTYYLNKPTIEAIDLQKGETLSCSSLVEVCCFAAMLI